jgi:hypothetical protein
MRSGWLGTIEPPLEPGRASLISVDARGRTILDIVDGFIDAGGSSFTVTQRDAEP